MVVVYKGRSKGSGAASMRAQRSNLDHPLRVTIRFMNISL